MAQMANKLTCLREHQFLSPHAAFADESRGRRREEPECEIRTVFQRDRDRIIHCDAFRRLKHKTQVFLSPVGDHYRTRLTHTLEVSQIARTIAVALCLNETLTEAIALGHDLGHTPFGHAGERALDAVNPDGFQHYAQSLRVVDLLEKDGRGLNLTWEVRNGILNHTRGQQPDTWEGRVVRIADRIAYINHDIEDAISAGVMQETDIPSEVRRKLGENKSKRIDTLVRSVIESSNADIRMDDDVWESFDMLHQFMFQQVYTNPVCKSEEIKAIALLKQLYAYFLAQPDDMPGTYRRIAEAEGVPRAVCDYIAGMTDRYAVSLFRKLYIPEAWTKL